MITFFLKTFNRFYKSRPVQAFIEDMRSLRALWCWIFLVFFLVITTYVTLTNPSAQPTIIMSLSGVVSIIFTSYVASTSYEKVNGVPQQITPLPEDNSNENQTGA